MKLSVLTKSTLRPTRFSKICAIQPGIRRNPTNRRPRKPFRAQAASSAPWRDDSPCSKIQETLKEPQEGYCTPSSDPVPLPLPNFCAVPQFTTRWLHAQVGPGDFLYGRLFPATDPGYQTGGKKARGSGRKNSETWKAGASDGPLVCKALK